MASPGESPVRKPGLVFEAETLTPVGPPSESPTLAPAPVAPAPSAPDSVRIPGYEVLCKRPAKHVLL
jgi:hypothetical protein